jgi:hypothetical protein
MQAVTVMLRRKNAPLEWLFLSQWCGLQVPGKNPAEAVRAYVAPLQQSMSCFGNAVIRPDGYEPGVLHTITLPSPTIELLTQRDEILNLSFIQHFDIENRWFGWKVCTRCYMYAVEDDGGREIVAFHWHPDLQGDNSSPHMHICAGAGERIRSEIREIHFPTPRLAFEEIALMLIEDFEVVAERPDAVDVLRANLLKFRKFKSW